MGYANVKEMWYSTHWPRYRTRRRNIVVMWPTRI